MVFPECITAQDFAGCCFYIRFFATMMHMKLRSWKKSRHWALPSNLGVIVNEYDPDHAKYDEPDYEEMRQKFAKELSHQSDAERAASECATSCPHKYLIIMLDVGPLGVVTASKDLLWTTVRQHITLAITPVGADSLWLKREAIRLSCDDLKNRWIHLQDTPMERPRELLTLRQGRVLEEADQRCHDTIAVANISERRLQELMKAHLIELATPMDLNGVKTVGIDAVYSMFGRDNSRKNAASDVEATCVENHMNAAAVAEVTSLGGQFMYSVRLKAHELQKDSALYSLCWYLKEHLLHSHRIHYNEPRREVVVIPPGRWHVSYKGTVQGEDDIVELACAKETQDPVQELPIQVPTFVPHMSHEQVMQAWKELESEVLAIDDDGDAVRK